MPLSNNYYTENLSAERLKRCYDIAPPRVKQYLEAEINFVAGKINPNDIVLELGCGYGRAMLALATKARNVVGIDTSLSNLKYGKNFLGGTSSCRLILSNAAMLPFPNRTFDKVVCIQNGISAFHIDQAILIKESVRVAKRGGTVFFSSYSDKFWVHRLEWFRLQSTAGLIGEIDFEKTNNGMIVCKDGFIASTVGRAQFLNLTAGLDAQTKITEVDESSIFCEIIIP